MSLSLLPELLLDFGHAPELQFDSDYFNQQFEQEQQRIYNSASELDLELMSTFMGNAHGLGYEEHKSDYDFDDPSTWSDKSLEEEYGKDKVCRIYVPVTYDLSMILNRSSAKKSTGFHATFLVPEDVDHKANEIYFKPESYGYYKTKFGVYRPDGYDFSQEVLSKIQGSDRESFSLYSGYHKGASEYYYNGFINQRSTASLGLGVFAVLGLLLLLK